MSHISRITLIGIYNYDNSIFEGVSLPSGINKNTFIDVLLTTKGEQPVLLTNPVFLKSAITTWSEKWYHSFEKIYAALMEEYDPLHNYDRHEEYTDSENRTLEGTNTNNSSDSRSATISDSATTSSSTTSNGDTENKVSAYNESTYQPDNKSTTTSSGTDSSSTSAESSNESTETSTSRGTTGENEEKTHEHSAHLYGNIGVTKSQEMLKDELIIRSNYNIYDTIAEIFSNEMLLYIY